MEASALVFHGEVLDGFSPDEVKQKLGELLRLDEARVARLFSGHRNVLKQSVGPDEAARYVKRFAQVGARLRIESAAADELSLAPMAPAAVASTPPDPVVKARQDREQVKLEAEREARAARLAAHRAARGLPDESSAGPDAAPVAPVWGFGFDGRIGRVSYASATMLMFAMTNFVARTSLSKGGLMLLVGAVVTLLTVFQLVRLTALRTHDHGRNGWWAVLMLVPLLNVVVWLASCFRPGSDGDNEHGEPPQQGNWLWFGLSLALMVGVSYWIGSKVQPRPMSAPAGSAAPIAFEPVNESTTSILLVRQAQDFTSVYMREKDNKAFAISAAGHWGHAAGAASITEAVAQARLNCEAARVMPSAAPCGVVNINGQAVREKR
jgi:uncharacterized membrane protein YhaH (DUF805 family)